MSVQIRCFLVEVIVLANNAKEALVTVLTRYGNGSCFVCEDYELKVEPVEDLTLSVYYNS